MGCAMSGVVRWVNGYCDGQSDALAWLTGCAHEEDDPIDATIHGDANRARASLWCLAHNLAIGGALCRAFHIGWTSYYERSEVGLSAPFWRPGCGRRAP